MTEQNWYVYHQSQQIGPFADEQVRQLVSAIIGEELPKSIPTSGSLTRSIQFMCVVPLRNPNSHHYRVGEVVMILDRAVAIDQTVHEGDYLPEYGDTLRCAEKFEIEDFVRNLHMENFLKSRLGESLKAVSLVIGQ